MVISSVFPFPCICFAFAFFLFSFMLCVWFRLCLIPLFSYYNFTLSSLNSSCSSFSFLINLYLRRFELLVLNYPELWALIDNSNLTLFELSDSQKLDFDHQFLVGISTLPNLSNPKLTPTWIFMSVRCMRDYLCILISHNY